MPMKDVSLLDCARMACDTMMRKYAPGALPPEGRFHYHQGVLLSGMYQVYLLCRDERYYDYVKAWVDAQIDAYGNISRFNPGQLDDLQPGVLLFPLYERSGDRRYKQAVDTIAYYMTHYPANPEGGFWHKAWYRNQMWLDSLYMGGPFCAMYGARFDQPAFFDSLLFQAEMMEQKTRDDATGLWYHAWDYERAQPWADPETGRSPEFWGRAMGWVPMALLDELDYLPKDYEGRASLERMLRDLLLALIPYQDAESGLWYQVVDKGGQAGNWLESSCTCLYAAAIYRAVRQGIMDRKHLDTARRASEGIRRRLKLDGEDLLVENICVGTGVGDYAHYCARPVRTNDLHGTGAFLMMCAEAQQTL